MGDICIKKINGLVDQYVHVYVHIAWQPFSWLHCHRRSGRLLTRRSWSDTIGYLAGGNLCPASNYLRTNEYDTASITADGENKRFHDYALPLCIIQIITCADPGFILNNSNVKTILLCRTDSYHNWKKQFKRVEVNFKISNSWCAIFQRKHSNDRTYKMSIAWASFRRNAIFINRNQNQKSTIFRCCATFQADVRAIPALTTAAFRARFSMHRFRRRSSTESDCCSCGCWTAGGGVCCTVTAVSTDGDWAFVGKMAAGTPASAAEFVAGEGFLDVSVIQTTSPLRDDDSPWTCVVIRWLACTSAAETDATSPATLSFALMLAVSLEATGFGVGWSGLTFGLARRRLQQPVGYAALRWFRTIGHLGRFQTSSWRELHLHLKTTKTLSYGYRISEGRQTASLLLKFRPEGTSWLCDSASLPNLYFVRSINNRNRKLLAF